MLRGFPSDFPNSPTAVDENEEMNRAILYNENGLFIRNCTPENTDNAEIEVVDVVMPVAKKAKIANEIQNAEEENVEMEGDVRRVKFSTEPPKEFLTFPDSDYDRSSFGREKGKRYLIHDPYNEIDKYNDII